MFNTRPAIILIISGWGLTAPGPANAFGLANVPNLQFLSQNYPFFELKVPTENKYDNLKVLASAADLIDFEARLLNVVNNNSLKHNPDLNGLISDITGTTSKLHIFMRADYFGSINYKVSLSILDYLKHTKLNTTQVKFYFLINDTSDKNLLAKYIQTITEKIKSMKLGNIAGIAEIDYHSINSSVMNIAEFVINAKAKVAPNTAEILEKIIKSKKFDSYVISRKDAPFQVMQNMDAILDLNLEGDGFAEMLRLKIVKAFEKSESKTHGIDYKNLSDLPNIHEGILIKPFEPITTISRFFSGKQIYQTLISPRDQSEQLKLVLNSRAEILPGQDLINIFEVNNLKEQKLIFEKLKNKLQENKYGLSIAYINSLYRAAQTGKVDEIVEVIEELDKEISEIANFALHHGLVLAITSDIGVAEAIYNSKGDISMGSNNPVPAIFIDNRLNKLPKKTGVTKDFVPTLLNLCGFLKPGQMDGINLIDR